MKSNRIGTYHTTSMTTVCHLPCYSPEGLQLVHYCPHIDLFFLLLMFLSFEWWCTINCSWFESIYCWDLVQMTGFCGLHCLNSPFVWNYTDILARRRPLLVYTEPSTYSLNNWAHNRPINLDSCCWWTI